MRVDPSVDPYGLKGAWCQKVKDVITFLVSKSYVKDVIKILVFKYAFQIQLVPATPRCERGDLTRDTLISSHF